ncbi:Hypothetical protein PBPRB1673 [Photobacterium profundum SS9]|uniref:Uncharacterized protein n=2 Tax=Photobacterium profundum TaxID=74109 RepID=Q6LGP7_PHOPR|nr:Hypothetical protein PBPRB1673 [Photobacterium profundum SS9]
MVFVARPYRWYSSWGESMIISSISEIYNGVVNHYQFTVACHAENQTPENTAAFRISRLNERVANQLNALADMGDGELAHKFQMEAQSLELHGNSPTPV